MKKILMFLFVLIFLGKVYAQTASITGTVTDSDSQLWLNGTWTYTFYPNVNYPNLNSYYVGSTPLSTYYNAPVSGILDPSAATFTMSNMVRSDKISPSGSMWTLQFCPNATSKCGSFNYNLTADSVTGSTINSLITAAIPAPRFEPIAGAFGYNDTEAIINPTAGTPGGTYWNVISACQRYYSNMSPIGWACGSGSSGGSITGQANGVIPLATGATSIGAQSHIDDGVTTPSTVTSTEGIAAPNYIGPVQQFQPYTLRSTLTKTGLMALYTAGNASYTSPAQLNIMMLGDSTGFMHTGVIPCQLTAAYGAAGYMGQQLGSNVSGIGFNCATSAGGNAPTLAGGAYWVDGSTYAFDFAHSPNGQYWVIPPGGSLVSDSTFVPYSTDERVYYTSAASGANIVVSTGSGSTWTALGNGGTYSASVCNGAVTANVGGVCHATMTRGINQLQITNPSGTANLYVMVYGQHDTTVNGTVFWQTSRGGLSVPDYSSTPNAVVQPWLNDFKPDLITSEWKTNGVVGGTGGCQQATTAAPTVFQNYSYWFANMMTPIQTANALADFVVLGDYDYTTPGVSCVAPFNKQVQQWAAAQIRPQTYVDEYTQLTNADQATLGWNTVGNAHQTALGQTAGDQLMMQYLGIGQWPNSPVTRDIIAQHYVNTAAINLNQYNNGSNYSVINGYPSTSTDILIKSGRSIIGSDQSGHAIFNLGSTTVAYAQGNNSMPCFQFVMLNTSGTLSGNWLCSVGGQAGVWSNPGGSAPAPWYTSSLRLPTSGGGWDSINGNPAGAGSPTFVMPTVGGMIQAVANETSTAAIAFVAPVKADTAHANQVVITTTTDTSAGIVIGVCINNPAAAAACNIATTGVWGLTLGTGTCAIGNFVIVDTTTNGDVKCTATYTAGMVIGVAMAANSTVGTTFNVMIGLR